ncbi:MAG: pyruvate dehydrogenase complex dihydrolipoamide acetyltransferase [Pseudomonadota bacterium]
MAIALKMPALSPTMEEGTLAKWLVKEGDEVTSGDLLAEIETDKATMEFEAVDEGTIAKVLVGEGSENVAVGEVIAILAEDGEDIAEAAKMDFGGAAPAPEPAASARAPVAATPAPAAAPAPAPSPAPAPAPSASGRIKASPLARRIAADKGLDLAAISGSGPKGRIIKADVEGVDTSSIAAPAATGAAPAPAPAPSEFATDIPHEAEKLGNVRKVIARRLTEAKQTIPHIYLTLDIRLDALLKLRKELNAALEPKGIKLSVNDLLIKALAKALMEVPKCNVSFAGDQLIKYSRADISVAVAAPSGLITPIIKEADTKSLSAISTEMKELAGKARDGKLQPHEYQGGTASISNMGMFGITQFDAVINPPQGMILAVGAGEKRPAVIDDSLQIATMMSATGSFDHRAIDGADGAELMQALKQLIESPMGLVA